MSEKIGLDDFLTHVESDKVADLPTEEVMPRPHFKCIDSGVYFFDVEKDKAGNLTQKEPVWICSKLQIMAKTRTIENEDWGRLLVFSDDDGLVHYWPMPMEFLKGFGDDIRGELLKRGLHISPSAEARKQLLVYLQTAAPKNDARAICTDKTGWHNRLFILPKKTVGKSDEIALYQSTGATMNTYNMKGELWEWKENVSKMCIGNSRLVFAVSSAFAGILLFVVNGENGGINFVGESSIGKTTVLYVAASTFGAHDYLQRWRATSNGLEAIAVLHNDSLLILDELAQVNAREAGEIAYLLSNGSGKARAGKTGSARKKAYWRLMFLSSGEIGLAEHMSSVGNRVRAGQEVRLVDIPADAGMGHGIFEDLHGHESGCAFSRYLKKGTGAFYGTAAIAFIQSVQQQWDEVANFVQHIQKSFHDALPANASGQAQRVAERFGLIAAAGELATACDITGWPEGEAIKSAVTCFQAWLSQRGGVGAQEYKAILSQVRMFFESHGDGRFTIWDEVPFRSTSNRAGFSKMVDGANEFFVLSEVFRNEICAGHNPQTVAKVLVEMGLLLPGSDGRPTKLIRLPGMKQTRCYHFSSAILSDES